MGLMETLRNSTKYVVIILIVAFGLIWVLADVDFFGAVTAGPNALGVVNGDKISVEEYQNRIQYYTNSYTQQTGNSMTPEVSAFYENQVWEELVNQRLIQQKMDELGITVTDNELLDMVYGDNPDPIIVQNFQRQDGTIDRAYISQVLSDERFSQDAIFLDIQLRQQRRQQKLTNYLTSGLQVTQKEVQDEFMKRNSFAEVDFVRFPYSEIPNDEIEVSDSELRSYYNENKDDFKQEESYRAKYVTFSKLPTASDSAEIKKEVEALMDDFAVAQDDSVFLVQQLSATPYNSVFVKKDEVREDYVPVLDVNVGEVTEPIISGGQVSIIKKVDENRTEVKFVVFSRIIEALPSTIRDADEAARDFQLFATEETDFETEAERAGLQIQESFATKGNPFISGLGSSQQVSTFLESAKVGEVSDVIELSSNFVVVKLETKTEEGFQSLDEVRPIVETQVKIQKRKDATLEKVNSLLSGNSELEALAAADGKEVQNASSVAANATVISGGGRAPEVVGAIFEMSEGQTSNALAGASAVYVVRVNSKQMADLATLDAATENQIRQELEQQLANRYNSVWLAQLKESADIEDNRDRLLSR